MADYHPAQPPSAQSSTGGSRHTDAASQVTACHRCRKQKLRCSKDIPSCKRCLDISVVCTYPAPPDRKLLAAQRAQNAKTRSLRDPGHPSELREHEAGNSHAVSNDRSPVDYVPLQAMRSSNLDTLGSLQASPAADSTPPRLFSQALLQVSLPSRQLALELIDAYFDHVYNATLLFHKQTLISDYMAGKISDCVALSVFALAANFLSDSKGPNREYHPSLPGSSRPGEDWARAASQQVLMNCDQPRYETVQACQTIALYWWAFNQTDRTYMHNQIAYHTCRLLGYHSPRASVSEKDDAWNCELKRRAFWCSWSMCCLSQNNASFKAESWKEAVGLPLPCDEMSFSACQPLVREAFGPDGRLQFLQDCPGYEKTSYMAEIVKLISLWWEVQRFAKRYVNSGPLDSLRRLSQLQELDQQLELIHDNLSPCFQYTSQSSFASRDARHGYQIFSIHALYHLCVCTVHSSIVPVFSNIPPDPRISKKLTRLSAEEAVKHSLKLCTMATEFLGITADKSRCPSFTAYAMFVAASIQFKSLGAQGILRGESIGKIYPAISILERTKRIWRPLEGLWSTLDTLFKGAGMDIKRLSETRQLLSHPESDPDIDRIVAQGVTSGNTDIYTYVPNDILNEDSSRQSSNSLSRRSSDSSQQAPYYSHNPSTIAKSNVYQAPASSEQAAMPIHSRNPHRMHWTGVTQQPRQINPDGSVLQQHSMHSGAPPGFMPMNSMPENVQGGRLGLQHQVVGTAQAGPSIRTGVDSMDLDPVPSNLWWDRPFESIPTEQYGVWYPETFQGTDGSNYYQH